jgi:uncharacterized membrane protein YeiB
MEDKAATIIIWILILMIPVSVVVWNHVLRKRDEFKAEHYRRFVQPRIERGLALGISYERLQEIYQEAQSQVVDPTIVGGAPGAIFDSLIDLEVERRLSKGE